MKLPLTPFRGCGGGGLAVAMSNSETGSVKSGRSGALDAAVASFGKHYAPPPSQSMQLRFKQPTCTLVPDSSIDPIQGYFEDK